MRREALRGPIAQLPRPVPAQRHVQVHHQAVKATAGEAGQDSLAPGQSSSHARR